MKLVNLTGHDLSLTDKQNIVRLPWTGPRARVISEGVVIDRLVIEGLDEPFPVTLLTRREVISLPDPEPDTMFVVSGLVAAYSTRLDVVAPGRIFRDPVTNRVVGCQGFVKSVDPGAEHENGGQQT